VAAVVAESDGLARSSVHTTGGSSDAVESAHMRSQRMGAKASLDDTDAETLVLGHVVVGCQ
jgi:hypothetical protein